MAPACGLLRSCLAAVCLALCGRRGEGFHGTPKGSALLAQEQGKAGFRLCNWGPEAYYKGRSGRAQAVWNLAHDESGLEAQTMSDFACNVPKVPWAWVEVIQKMDHTKRHTFNFQGSYMFGVIHQQMGDPRTQYAARNWIMDFVKANFTDIDMLKISDITEDYTPIGPYDHSQLGGYNAHHPNGTDDSYFKQFDAGYFEEMAASNFTLAPGGDRPWSMRFYEAILAGSIPVVSSKEYDVGAMDMWALWSIPYKYYFLGSGEELVYRQDWVDQNLELFIKYQTFHNGDNVPPEAAPKPLWR